MAPPAADVDVAVVGAGLAGLAAARAVRAAGATTVVLEARDRVGGRVLNEPLGDGEVVELGGQWVGPTQTRLLALAAELGVPTFPTWSGGENVVEWRGRVRRYRGTVPRISPLVLADVRQAQARLELLARRVAPEAPWAGPRADEHDGTTVEAWLRRATVTRGARDLLTVACRAVWAAEPRELSLLHLLFYVRSAGGLDPLLDTAGGAQEARFVGGSQAIALRMAAALGEGVVRLEAPVRSLAWDAGGATVGDVRARRVVVALPPVLAARIAYAPALPAARDGLTQRMAQGAVWKCMAVFAEPFWRRAGLNGQGLSDAGPVALTFDNSPPGGRPGVLLGFLEGAEARRAEGLAPGERRRRVLDAFARLFGPAARSPERYIERSWAGEEWSRGCYGGFFGPGGWTAFGPALRAPVGPLHWAGAETATVWNGYMDGAVRSGERAAAEALRALA